MLRHFISQRVSLRVLNGTRKILRISTPKRNIRRLLKRNIHESYVYVYVWIYDL